MVKRTNVVLVVVCALGTVLVQPALAGDHSQKGEWELAVLEWPLQAIHMVLMKNGKVLCLYVQAAEKNIIAVDPSTDPPTVTEPQTQPEDFFCSGHSQLGDPNGKILFAGGGLDPEGHHFAHTFDPVELDLGQNPWEVMEDIVTPGDTRFYPTATTLGNGLVLLTAGRDSTSSDDPADEDFPALFNLNPPASDPQWTRMDESAEKVIHWYSFMFQLTDGNVFMGGGSFSLKMRTTPTWTFTSIRTSSMSASSSGRWSPRRRSPGCRR